MSDQVMSVNLELVGSTINQISSELACIQAVTLKLHDKILEKNNATQGKFALLDTLSARVEEETHNVEKLVEAQEEIKQSLNRYAELADEANDDSAFRR
jgi:Tfp pilus assembly protein PilN